MKSLAMLALAMMCLALVSGCAQPQNEGKSLLELEQLKAKYGVAEKFSANVSEMNDYVNELSILRAKSGGNAAKAIDAELYSAQSLYYLLGALDASVALGNYGINCNSAEARTLKSASSLAASSSEKAVAAMGQIDPSNLRPNQLDSVKGYGQDARDLLAEIERVC